MLFKTLALTKEMEAAFVWCLLQDPDAMETFRPWLDARCFNGVGLVIESLVAFDAKNGRVPSAVVLGQLIHNRVYEGKLKKTDADAAADLILLGYDLHDAGKFQPTQVKEELARQLRDWHAQNFAVEAIPALVGGNEKQLASAAQKMNDLLTIGCASVGPTRLSSVPAASVSWLWPKWIPGERPTLLVGDPGLGKTTAALDIGARLSRASCWPDENGPGPSKPGRVLLLSAEDGLADVLRPRVEAAGGDPDLFHAVDVLGAAEGSLRLPNGAQILRRHVERTGARLVVIDPLVAFVDGGLDLYRDQHARQVMVPLAQIGAQTGAAIVAVIHLRKGAAEQAIYRPGGSIGFVAAARSVLLVGRSPADPDARVLCCVKSNLGRPPPSLGFRIEEAPANGAARILWTGEAPYRAEDLLAPPAHDEDPTVVEEAKAFLADALAPGPQPAKKVAALGLQNGISATALRRAKTALHVTSAKDSYGGGWVWTLPPTEGAHSA